MKINILILFFISQVILAQSAFEKGNQLYKKENYSEAITSYESILSSGNHSAELYFNLGNCYYKLHKVALSVYNYEKALQLNPNDDEIKTNLDFARKMTIDDIKVIPKVGFNKLIDDFTSIYNYNTWAKLTVLFAFIFLCFFAGYYLSGTTFKKRIFFIGMFVVLLFITVSMSSGIYEKNRFDSEKQAIIFSESVSVKGEPKASSPETILLHEGTKVFIIESIANWKKIQLTDETIGWISEDAIKELN